jgi:flagellar protein FliS
MSPNSAALTYRRVSTESASTVGLLIALYDTLIGDLQRAATAMREGDIALRCRQLNHAFSILTQLDCLIDSENGGGTATQLRYFYEYLRKEMLRAQFVLDSEILRRAAFTLLDVREAWQQVETRVDREPEFGGSRTAAAESRPAAPVSIHA